MSTFTPMKKKIILIGDSHVGKTCLAFRFCKGVFLTQTSSTLGLDFFEKEVNIDGEKLILQLWDTAGQEQYHKSMIAHYYRKVDAVVFVYDVTEYKSFANLSVWINEVNEYIGTSKNIPRILVGNKCDCADQKAVDTKMAKSFADIVKMSLFETSACNDSEAQHIGYIFIMLAHELKKQSLSNEYQLDVLRLEENDSKKESSCCASEVAKVEEFFKNIFD